MSTRRFASGRARLIALVVISVAAALVLDPICSSASLEAADQPAARKARRPAPQATPQPPQEAAATGGCPPCPPITATGGYSLVVVGTVSILDTNQIFTEAAIIQRPDSTCIAIISSDVGRGGNLGEWPWAPCPGKAPAPVMVRITN